MKVRDVMTTSAVCCKPDTNVGASVELLWSHDCGMLSVVGPDNKLIGIVTDRDICIAMGTRNRLPGELTVGEIAITKVFTCRTDDEIHEALETMTEKQVRRLPVVSADGVPQGILSMDDIIYARRFEQMGRMVRVVFRRNHSEPEVALRQADHEGSS